ncbi:hypothetical protein AB0M87_14825 [Streptomyces sp. NPDC051320]|uniref:hypothetical protein n=1 Tax=Streptomyces sp. NPDC051320 TaxID=3154644 RepID=UPI003430CBB6
MDLDAVADELYGLRPDDFTATRNERARTARAADDRPLARQISKLRRPSLSAWASNLLVREHPEEIEPLIQLGAGLRQAHQDLDGEQLRELSGQQRSLISALSRQAGHLAAEAGHPISEDAQREVENTLHAVLADPQAARDWAKGRLIKPLDATLSFAAAAGASPDSGRPPGRAEKQTATSPHASHRQARATADKQRRRRLAEARREAEDAERELLECRNEAATADREAERAGGRVTEGRQRVVELTDELKKAEEQHRRSRDGEREARDRARARDRKVREAERRAQAAAAHVKSLADPGDDP